VSQSPRYPVSKELREFEKELYESRKMQRDTLSEATVTLRTVVTFVTWNRVSSFKLETLFHVTNVTTVLNVTVASDRVFR